MNKEKIIEQLNLIIDKKERAVKAQSYEMALQLRDKEKELIQELKEFELNEKNQSK